MSNLTILSYGEIRVTNDGRFSVFDTIRVVGGKKDPYNTWIRLCEGFPEVLTKCQDLKFPGRGQKETPVADTEGIFYIIGLLPGAAGHTYRETAAREMCRKYGKTYEEIIANNKEKVAINTDVAVAIPSPKDIADAIGAVFSVTDINKNLVAGVIANEIGRAYPQLKPHLESAKSLLPAEVAEEVVSVTALARMYVETTGLPLSKNNTDHGNAISMNKLLIQKGLQVKNPSPSAKKDGQPQYLPTEVGKPHSAIVFQQGEDSNKTIQQLRWLPSVLKLLIE
jgi:hypothetical protein